MRFAIISFFILSASLAYALSNTEYSCSVKGWKILEIADAAQDTEQVKCKILERVEKVMRLNSNGFRNCYERMLRIEPLSGFALTMRLELSNGSATVLQTDVTGDEPDSTAMTFLRSCFEGRVKEMAFGELPESTVEGMFQLRFR